MRDRPLIRLALGLALVLTTMSALLAPSAEAAPDKPTDFSVVIDGPHSHAVSVQWDWHAGVSAYELQAATDTAFTDIVSTTTVPAPAKEPTGGVVSATADNLPSATIYFLRVRAVTVAAASASASAGWSSTLTASTVVAQPAPFAEASAVPGPKVGQITFFWSHDGLDVTSFEVETALSPFDADLVPPVAGRHDRVFTVGPDKRSLTLTKKQVAEAGAPLGSGVHLLYRITAVNKGSGGQQVRRSPALAAVEPEQALAAIGGDGNDDLTSLQVGTFNVRTSKATTDKRPWLKRRTDVAQTILDHDLDLVTMQELGPGRADGKSGSTTGTVRQTVSLLDSLKKLGGSRYKLVRTTTYVEKGTPHGTQGTRILYDSKVLTLLSKCPETTNGHPYSSSCSIELPILKGDSAGVRRSAAYAKFSDRATGAKFYVVSAHLDQRHDEAHPSVEATYDALRGTEMQKILSTVAKVNTDGLPVILGGDLNSRQHNAVGDAPHDALIAAKFFDSESALERTNLQLSTYNGFAQNQEASTLGYGSRLDGIYLLGGTALSYENVTTNPDPARPSDHNLQTAHVLLSAG